MFHSIDEGGQDSIQENLDATVPLWSAYDVAQEVLPLARIYCYVDLRKIICKPFYYKFNIE